MSENQSMALVRINPMAMATEANGDPVAALVARRKMIVRAMKDVMVKGTDYGTIPGCGDKPALFKPGAEKLCNLFSLAPEFIVEDKSKSADEVRYLIRTRIVSSVDGSFCGEGLGECSSNEEKYRWKGARRIEWDHAPEDRRRIKYVREKGKEIEILQVRTNPADVANTILKMGKKRSHVDATITATATGDMLTQDLEDLIVIEEVREADVVKDESKPTKPEPKTETKPAKPADDVRYIGIVEETRKTFQGDEKDGVKPPLKNYKVYVVREGDREYEASCWDSDVARIVSGAREAGCRVKATVKTNPEGKIKIVKAESEADASTCNLKAKSAEDQIADAMQGGQ